MIKVIIMSVLLGAVAGSFVLYVSWNHNPQCEFHCEGVIYWRNWLPYGIVAFLLVCLPINVFGWVAKFAKSKL